MLQKDIITLIHVSLYFFVFRYFNCFNKLLKRKLQLIIFLK